jgi:thiamine biosynthesis lipoprotein
MKFIFTITLLCLCISMQAAVMRSRHAILMGGRFDITIVAADSATAEHYIDSVVMEVARIEALISDWKPSSQVSEINRRAGFAGVKVDRELLELTRRAIRISELTNGAFDISFAAMEKIWRFDGSMTAMPDPAAVRKAVSKVGYRNIIVDTVASTVLLKLPGMKIGFGALGEGYATDRCRDMLQAKGVQAGIVNATGDMSTWGKQINGKPWTVGISDPFRRGELYAVVPLRTSAVTTSGSYEKYVELNGVRYSHIINPATGYPATGLSSVTVFGPSAEQANALSTSIMVLGKEAGFALLRGYSGYSCVVVSDEGKFSTSPGFRLKRIRRK